MYALCAITSRPTVVTGFLRSFNISLHLQYLLSHLFMTITLIDDSQKHSCNHSSLIPPVTGSAVPPMGMGPTTPSVGIGPAMSSMGMVPSPLVVPPMEVWCLASYCQLCSPLWLCGHPLGVALGAVEAIEVNTNGLLQCPHLL